MADNFPKDTSHFKLLISDFDGTLVGLDHNVSAITERAVKKWISKNKFFTIATGRQYLMIKDECEKLGLTTPIVVRGGAEVVDPNDGSVIYSAYISKVDVSKIFQILLNSGLFYFCIEKDEYLYSNFRIEVDFDEIVYRTFDEFVLRDVPKFHAKPIDQDDPRIDEIIKEITLSIPTVNVIATHNSSFGKGWDITSTKATKLHGIVKVLEILGIEREQTVGVGDSYNDFPLLEAAGFKVAMGNAHPELKEIADVVVPTNNENGVAFLIDKLLEKY